MEHDIQQLAEAVEVVAQRVPPAMMASVSPEQPLGCKAVDSLQQYTAII